MVASQPVQPTEPTSGTLKCFPPISLEEWNSFSPLWHHLAMPEPDAVNGPRLFTPVQDDDQGITAITVTSAGDDAALFAALQAFVAKFGYPPPSEEPGGPNFMSPDGVTPLRDWRTFTGRIDGQQADGTPKVWGVCGHDVVDLHIEAPEPLLDLLEQINSGTVDEVRRTKVDGYDHHLLDLLDDLAHVLGEYDAGIDGAVSRETLFATLPPKGSQAYEAACELQLDGLAVYTTELLAAAIGIPDAWAQRIATRAAERGITRGDLTDPVVQAKALT